MIRMKNDQEIQTAAARNTLISAMSIVLVPLCATIGLAALVFFSSSRDLRDTLVQERLVEASDASTKIIDALQKERGRSSGYIGSAGSDFYRDLQAQRKATDAAIAAHLPDVSIIGEIVAERTGSGVIEAVETVEDALSPLRRMRERVDMLAVGRDEMMQFYTSIVTALLSVSDLSAGNGEMAQSERIGLAATALLEAVEYAGRERAIGASAFGSEFTTRQEMVDMVSLNARGEALVDRFLRLAPSSHAETLRDILAGDAARRVADLRAMIRDQRLDPNVSGPDWFEAATRVLDRMQALAAEMRADQLALVAEARVGVQTSYWIAIGAIAATLAACIAAAVWQSWNFVRPLRDLVISLGRIASGEADVRVAGGTRRDLVGALARSVDRLGAIMSERFQDALRHAPIATSIEDVHGAWIRQNPAMLRLLGLDLCDVPRPLEEYLDPEDAERDIANRAALREGRAEASEAEITLRRQDGSIVIGHVTRSHVAGAGDAPDFFITQILDVTEARKIEVLKTNFVSTVSHELRTPLTSVRGAIGMLQAKRAGQADAGEARLIELAISNCKRLLTLINDLLDMDRLAQGGVTLEIDRHDVVTLAHDALDELGPYAQGLDVGIAFENDGKPIFARTDAVRFAQVLTNLVSNAAKFAPKGTNVEVGIGTTDDMIRVDVSDRGPGIDPDFANHVFERFRQADDTGKRMHGGSGVGLHIAKGLVQQLGGQIGFENNAGRGATFWFTLPLMGQKSEGATVAASDPECARPKVLHIEDDASLCELLATALGDRVNVVAAHSYAQAERLLSERSFDLILLDWELPDGTGLDLLRHEAIVATTVPIVSLSANADTIRPARVERDISKAGIAIEDIRDHLLAILGRGVRDTAADASDGHAPDPDKRTAAG